MDEQRPHGAARHRRYRRTRDNLHGIAGVVRAGRYYSPQSPDSKVESIAETRSAV
ncbi:MAG: hypothetical protein WBZ37_07265 [Mycobacterium sp.]